LVDDWKKEGERGKVKISDHVPTSKCAVSSGVGKEKNGFSLIINIEFENHLKIKRDGPLQPSLFALKHKQNLNTKPVLLKQLTN
jgi:hypothetical protein